MGVGDTSFRRPTAGPGNRSLGPATSPTRRVAGTERGASEIFMLMLMTALLAFAGLAYDAGMAFNARRDATNLAAAAARTGANQVSTDALYGLGEARLASFHDSVDGRSAEQAAYDVLAPDTRLTEVPDIFRLNESELFVEVELTHETIFLQIIGIDDFVVTGSATAQVKSEQ